MASRRAGQPDKRGLGREIDARAQLHHYREHRLGLARRTRSELRVALDCANGSGCEVAPEILAGTGATVTTHFDQPDGVNINVDCGATVPGTLAAIVAGDGVDVGFALDGDADRCVAVDERGQIVDGDQLIGHHRPGPALAGRALRRRRSCSACSPTAAWHAPSRRPAAASLWRTPVGDKYILEAMQVSGAGLGGEKSGHVIMPEHTTSSDGIVTALEVLDILARTGKPLSELAAHIPLYPQQQRTIHVRHREQWEADLQLAQAVRAAEAELDGNRPDPGAPVGHRAGAADHGRGRGRRARRGAGRRFVGAREPATKLALRQRISKRPMCGIVGYIGPRDAAPILLEGLARLEYRGYDSAGIALVTTEGELFVEKRAGKLANLRTALLDATPTAAVGLAHTRWATHGRPNDLNAHPHVDCTGDVTVIHNGIIENFQELRDGLVERGHRLGSETDTEALAHLVEEAYRGHRGGRPDRAAPGAGCLRGGRAAQA